VVQVDRAAHGVNLRGYAKEDEEDDEPVDRVAFRLVSEGEEPVERVVPDGEKIDRKTDGPHDGQIALDPALLPEPTAQPANGC
jgi:hypothetical protein